MKLYRQRSKQWGLSLTGMLFWSIILAMVAILGMRLVPVYYENASIKKHLSAIASDSNLQNATAREVRLAFSKRAQVDDIKSITAKDIQVSRERGKNTLKAVYSVKVPLFANVSLQIDFDTNSN